MSGKDDLHLSGRDPEGGRLSEGGGQPVCQGEYGSLHHRLQCLPAFRRFGHPAHRPLCGAVHATPFFPGVHRGHRLSGRRRLCGIPEVWRFALCGLHGKDGGKGQHLSGGHLQHGHRQGH